MKREAARTIFSALRGMHQANRTVHTAYGVEDLGITESSALQEVLARTDGITSAELSRALVLSPVKISRLIKLMSQDGLIKRELRGTRLTIVATERGSTVFFGAHKNTQEIFSAAYDRIPAAGREVFIESLRSFCDDMGAVQATILPSDPPLMNEVRRITRVCGFLSRDAFGSGRSPLEWHVLNLIHTQPERTSAATLASTLGTSHTTMTTVLNRLEKWGWIKRYLSEADARARRLSLTDEGRSELLRVEYFGVALIERGLKRIKASQLEQFVDCFRAYAGMTENDGQIAIGGTFSIGRLQPAEFTEARGFVLEQRLKQRMLQEIPGYLLNDEHLNFAMRKGTELVAVFEFRAPTRSADIELVQGVAIADGRILKPAVIEAAYERICELLKQDTSLSVLPDLTQNSQRLSRSLQKAGPRTF